MPEYQAAAVISAFVLCYSLVASRLERSWFSGALIFVATGMMLGPSALGVLDLVIENETIAKFAEFALAVCLFTDSANADLRVIRQVERIPIRLLLVGLPLTIGLGMVVAWLIFKDLGIFEVALIGAMLAPTDAALGKAVVTNSAVPKRVRESLNVESGLNDGICVPVILFLLMAAKGSIDTDHSIGIALSLTLQVIGIGVLVGIVLALIGGFAVHACSRRKWIDGTWTQFPIIALSLLCFSLAQYLGGSGFIASFVGGLTFGAVTKQHKERFLLAAEGTADAIAMLTWLFFGVSLIPALMQGFRFPVLLYAVLSLTVIRMLPVALSLYGVRLRLDTILFMGWFGPRGLASIVFLAMILAEQLPGADVTMQVTSWTILLSVILHGISATPLANWYGNRVDGDAEEESHFTKKISLG